MSFHKWAIAEPLSRHLVYLLAYTGQASEPGTSSGDVGRNGPGTANGAIFKVAKGSSLAKGLKRPGQRLGRRRGRRRKFGLTCENLRKRPWLLRFLLRTWCRRRGRRRGQRLKFSRRLGRRRGQRLKFSQRPGQRRGRRLKFGLTCETCEKGLAFMLFVAHLEAKA